MGENVLLIKPTNQSHNAARKDVLMHTLIVMIVAFMFSIATVSTASASAGTGKPFYKDGLAPGMRLTPMILSDLIATNLYAHPDGKSMLDPDLCKDPKNGSCANPRDYLTMFQKSTPGSGLKEPKDLIPFLASLKAVDAPSGEYWLSCLIPDGKGGYKPLFHCNSRHFKPGEKVWIDPKTGKLILASDCTNPIEKEVPPKRCVENHFFTKSGDTVVRFALLSNGPKDVLDDCLGILRAGETEYDSMHGWTDECERKGCDFSEDAKVLNKTVRRMGSYIPAPGEHILRFSESMAEKDSPYTLVLCLERGDVGDPTNPPVRPEAPPRPDEVKDVPEVYEAKFVAYMEYLEKYESWSAKYSVWRDAWIGGHSDGIGVNWSDYRLTPSGTKVATVYYTKAEVPQGKPILYWPWNEYYAPKAQ